MIKSDGNTWVVYEVSGVMLERASSQIPAAIKPGTISTLGPTFGSS